MRVHHASFLFVGFSLSDPKVNLIRDGARLAMGDNMPCSYLAQERPDPVVRGYLDSLEVRTIALDSWNAMALLLDAITPRRPRNRIATVRKRGSFDAFLASSPT